MTAESNISISSRQMPSSIVTGVAASQRELDRLDADLSNRFGQSFSMVPLEPDASLPQSIITQSNILVLEIDPAVPNSLSRIEQARRQDPDKILIAAVAHCGMQTVRTLIRRGVNDVVSLPFDAEELFSAVMELGRTIATKPSNLAPMTGIVHSTGGIGGSTIASHLASGITNSVAGATCCLVDLDFQFGEMASLFDVHTPGDIVDCLNTGERLDFDIISNALVDVGSNITLLPAPNEIPAPESIGTENLLHLLTILRQNFDHVLLDFPVGWSDATLSAACSCDELLMVVDQSVRSLARAKKSIALLDSVDFPSDGISVVVNRAEKKFFQVIGPDEIERTIGRQVVASIPAVKSGLQKLQERGVLLTDEDPRSSFAKSIHLLADELAIADEEYEQ